MKKIYLIFIVIAVLIIGLGFVRFIIGGSEDDWIKDSHGVYVKHGHPSEIPDYVLEQQETIDCALDKFDSFEEEINSQCLGTCGNYAVDIVHVPRDADDDLPENQCEDYSNENVRKFIELDKEGDVVRIT